MILSCSLPPTSAMTVHAPTSSDCSLSSSSLSSMRIPQVLFERSTHTEFDPELQNYDDIVGCISEVINFSHFCNF